MANRKPKVGWLEYKYKKYSNKASTKAVVKAILSKGSQVSIDSERAYDDGAAEYVITIRITPEGNKTLLESENLNNG